MAVIAPPPEAPLLDVHIRRKAVPARAGRRDVLADVRFTLRAGEIVALVGPSGCGKTTLLRLIGGLDSDFEGALRWAGGAAPRIGTVFQEPRLLPWRTVAQNVALVRPPDPAAADALLDVLGLSGVRDAYPGALSLGMARRVAIARAFAVQPELVLLDEPFVSLDPAMAERGRRVLLDAWRARPTTALLVTHDLAEAASLADRIIALSNVPEPGGPEADHPDAGHAGPAPPGPSGPARLVGVALVPPELRRRGIETGARAAAGLASAYFRVSR